MKQSPKHLASKHLKHQCLIGSLLSASLLLGSASTAQAHMSQTNTGEFQRIEQSNGLKLGVTVAGVGLIGLELWWFLLSKPKAQKGKASESLPAIVLAAPQPHSGIAKAH